MTGDGRSGTTHSGEPHSATTPASRNAPPPAARRVLELRIHGVSNPPPRSTLDAGEQPLRLAAGDADTGFWRLTTPPAGPLVTEAYSWGQLTSGARTSRNDLRRALWMLLLPLSLVNVAFWARPRISADPARDRPWPLSADGLAGYLVRLVCLSLTGTLTLTATVITADLAGWQCAGRCPGTPPGTGFLTHGWWSVGSRPLAVGLLGPAAVLLVLWALSRRTYQYEAVTAHTAGRPAGGDGATQMDHPQFWRGSGQIRRLAMLHLAFGLASVTWVVAAAILVLDARAGARPWAVAAVLLPLLAAATLAPLVLLLRPAVVLRGSDGFHGSWIPLLLAVAGWLGTLGYALAADQAGLDQPHAALPVVSGAVSWLFAVQFLLVLAIAGLGRWRWLGLLPALVGGTALLGTRFGWLFGADWDAPTRFTVVLVVLVAGGALVVLPVRRRPRPGDPAATRGWLARPAWHGEAAAMLAGLGWLAAVLYSAAAIFRAADLLNGSEPAASAGTLLVPVSFAWSAATFPVLLVMVAAAAGVALWWIWRRGTRLHAEWLAEHPQAGPHQRGRYGEVATARARHQFIERHGLDLVGWLALPVVLVLAAGTAGGFTGMTPAQLFGADGRPEPVLAWLSNTGITLATLATAGLALAGYLAYRRDTARRTIGIVWDLSTFWPRAAHPFGPPCYTERVVPQLVTRICTLPPGDGGAGIVLFGHSQGSTIAAATVRQLPDPDLARLHLLTAGTQLNRLYGRVFPAFFGPAALRELSRRLMEPGGRDEPRWRSFHRDTDPLGYPIDVAADGWNAEEIDAAGDAIPLPDPLALSPSDGEVLDPPILGHSDYPESAAYRQARDAAARQLLNRSPR